MSNRAIEQPRPDLFLEQRLSIGRDAGRGNLVGIQPHMVPQDYHTGARLCAKLGGYLDATSREGWLQDRTVVVFPEHIGTWLVVADERNAVYSAETVAQAMRPILLPSPTVQGGLLVPGGGALRNVSLTYRPDGSPDEQVVHKAFPTGGELPFTEPGSVQALPVLGTPAGQLGILICADSWQPACYQVLRAQQVNMVVVPSFLGPNGVRALPWKGYDGAPAPADVDPTDRGCLTGGQARIKYALPGRISGAGAQSGMNVSLRGALWDLSSDGRTMVVHAGQVCQVTTAKGAAIVNLWMD